MSDKQVKRKYLVRLTKSTSYTVLVWARDGDEAVRVAEEDFDHLVENGERDGSSRSIECIDDLSQNPYCAKEGAYDIETGDWTPEQPKEPEQ